MPQDRHRLRGDTDLISVGDESNVQWDQSYTPDPVAVPGVTKIEGIGKA